MALSPTDYTPSIRIKSPPHYSHPSSSSSSSHLPSRPSPGPMSIPTSKPMSPSAPPPLPPPRYIDSHDASWRFSERDGDANSSASASIKSGSSLLGGSGRSLGKSYTGPQKNIDFATSDPKSPTEEYMDAAQQDQRVPDLQALLDYNKLQGEKHMGQRSHERSAQAYDKQVLSRIGGPRTPPRSAGAVSSGPGNDENSRSPTSFQALNGQLRPLSMPERRHSTNEPPRWPQSAGSSALSPSLPGLNSPMSEQGFERRHAPRFGSSSHFQLPEGLRSHRDSYDPAMFSEAENAVEDSGMHDLNISERSPALSETSRPGLKRRAESPPPESHDQSGKGANTQNNWSHRHTTAPASRQPPAARIQELQPGSLSSTASSLPQPSSFASSYGMSNASTATSYSSDMRSPHPYQHSNESPSSQPPQQMQAQQQQQMSPPQQQRMEKPPGPNRAPPIPHRRTGSSGLRPPGLWICDCCPKKPKKFESEEELRVHEMEKQYVCQYCHNRFKNKNEAERHQNSLHLRRHSWSCAAIQSFEDAFHPSTNSTLATAAAAHAAATSGSSANSYPPPAASDTCGYCGLDFVNPPNWDERVEHLNRVHKFGECNQSKKFFRADHFRQHLKHSHAGTSGRWTNMLENACMRDEPPPQPINPALGIANVQAAPGAPQAAMTSPIGQAPPARLSEMRDDD